MKGWTLNIDCDHPRTLLPYRAHLWDPDGRFRGDGYFHTKWGAKWWGRRQVRKYQDPNYSKRTVVNL